MNGERHQLTSVPHDMSDSRNEVSFLGRLRAWWERQQTAQRVLAADPFERMRMAQDLGVGLQDLQQLKASPRCGETLLPAMMSRFGVDQAALGPRAGGAVQDMRRVCAACPSKRRCRRALAANTPAEDCRGFCPNAETLAALGQGTIPHHPARP